MIIKEEHFVPKARARRNSDESKVAAYWLEGKPYMLFRSVDGFVQMREYRDGVWLFVEDSELIIKNGKQVSIYEMMGSVDSDLFPREPLIKIFARWLFKISYNKEIVTLASENINFFHSFDENSTSEESYIAGTGNGVSKVLLQLKLWDIL